MSNVLYIPKESDMPIIAKKLREKIDEKGISQKKLSELSGVSRSSIVKYLNGDYCSKGKNEKYYHLIKPVTLQKLCDALDCDMSYFTGKNKESTMDLHFVCNFTGLSEKTVRFLHDISNITNEQVGWKSRNNYFAVLDQVISDSNLIDLILEYHQSSTVVLGGRIHDGSQAFEYLDRDGNITLADAYKQALFDAIKTALNNITIEE